MLFSLGTTSFDSNCSTGCPTCGCSNPNCRSKLTIYYDSTSAGYRSSAADLRLLLEDVPTWQSELRETPRRMKLPFPANKPFKPHAHRRACY